ncbi:MAG: hypothetical protein RLZZ324_140 [Candidatus Parcubacteria bacterium]|jgi:hypothetical protein
MTPFTVISDDTDLPKNDHDRADCWHPHLHAGNFKPKSAARLLAWYVERYADGHPCGGIVSVSPFCTFAGPMYSRYAHRHHANGTYAVCPSCGEVKTAGFHDGNPLPRAEPCVCGWDFGLSDFLQPVFSGTGLPSRLLTTTQSDVHVTLAEACLASGEIVTPSRLPALIACLGLGGDLKTYDRLAAHRTLTELRDAVRDSDWPARDEWFDCLGSPDFRISVTHGAKSFLSVRDLLPAAEAKREARVLLAMPAGDLEAKARFLLAKAANVAGR